MTSRALLYVPCHSIEGRLNRHPPEIVHGAQTRLADNIYWEYTFVGAYYDICFEVRALPTQEEVVTRYITLNRASYETATPAVRDGMILRAKRNYLPLVREHHFFSLCAESGHFSAVFKSEDYDLNSKVDLILTYDGRERGVALVGYTPRSAYWEEVKEGRPRTLSWQGEMYVLRYEPQRLPTVGQVYLFTPQWVEWLVTQFAGAKTPPPRQQQTLWRE